MSNLVTDQNKALSILERRVQQEIQQRAASLQAGAYTGHKRPASTGELRRCVAGHQQMQQQNITSRSANDGVKGSSLHNAFKRFNADRQQRKS